MFGLGATELLLVLGIVTLLFGAKRLPGLGKALGEGISSFRKAGAELESPLKPLKGEEKQQSR